MEVERIKSIGPIARVKLDGIVYSRLVDVARDFERKRGAPGLARQLTRMFRKANQDVFFYTEMNPNHPKGCYADDTQVNRFVHFCTYNEMDALTIMRVRDLQMSSDKRSSDRNGEKHRGEKHSESRKKKGKKKPAKKHAVAPLPATVVRYSQTQIVGTRLAYFKDGDTLWIKISDLAAVLRPDSSLAATMPSDARRARLTLRSLRYKGSKRRGAYFGRFDDWEHYLMMLKVAEDNAIAKQTYDKLAKIAGTTETIVPADVQQELTGLSGFISTLRRTFFGASKS